MSLLPLILAGLFVIAAIVLSACRPRLRDNYVTDQVPAGLSCEELENWLQTHEAAVAGVVDGAEAGIEWASEKKQKTRYCFIYLHGFSATRRETSPVIETLATRYASNIVFVRLSGHGVRPTDELGRAEDWLQDVWNAWQIAAQLGDEVVIVATSTGAPLSVWLASQDKVCERLRAMLFLSPNFRIRNPFGFLLTWPLSVRWIHWIIGAWHEWEPETELHGKFWTSRYRTSSLIEMQKVLDWVSRKDPRKFHVPLAVMYMKNDPTIYPPAAISFFHRWGAQDKVLIPVSIDGDAEEHVFTGQLGGHHRTDWTISQFSQFLDRILV